MPHHRYPKELVLKDRSEVTLRTPEYEDIEMVVKFYEGISPSYRWFLKEDPCDPEVIRRWIDNQKEGKAFSVVAVAGNDIVAHAGLLLRPRGGRRHVARLRIMVAQEFRSKQLGTWMIFDLIKRAMEMDLEKIRADFVVGIDDRAIEAAQKMNFVKEALLRDYIRDDKGGYFDYQIMIKQLYKEWGDF